MAIVRVKLSASSNGQAIGLATIPTTIHTSTTAASTSDEVHIWVSNRTSSAATVVITMGTTGAGAFSVDVPGNSGPFLVVPGFFLASGLIAYAHGASSPTAFYAWGFANRLTTGA